MEIVFTTKKEWLSPTLLILNSKFTQVDPCVTAGKIGAFADGTLDLSNNPCGTS